MKRISLVGVCNFKYGMLSTTNLSEISIPSQGDDGYRSAVMDSIDPKRTG